LQTRAAYAYNGMGEMFAALNFEGNPLNVEHDRMGRKTALESADTGRKEQLLSRSRDDTRFTRTMRYRSNYLGQIQRLEYASVNYRYGADGQRAVKYNSGKDAVPLYRQGTGRGDGPVLLRGAVSGPEDEPVAEYGSFSLTLPLDSGPDFKNIQPEFLGLFLFYKMSVGG
jgi:hypothetical protein